MSDDTNHYQSVLLEEMRDEIRAVHETVAPMPTLCRDVEQLKTDMTEVKDRLTNVEVAVTDLSKQHCRLEDQVVVVEKATT